MNSSVFIKANYYSNKKVVEYISSDGSRLLKSGGSLNWRFNNPGNLAVSSFMRKQPGWIGLGIVYNPDEHKFSIFDSYASGKNASKNLLKNKYSDKTLSEVTQKYAPKGDGSNDPEKYSLFIMSETGISPEKKIKELNEEELNSVVVAMEKQEGHKKGKEKWVYTTNITVSDGARPISHQAFKVILDSKVYNWLTDENGKLQPIVHVSDGMKIEVRITEPSEGEQELLYQAVTGNESKNILLIKNFSEYTASTVPYDSETPLEKSKPEAIKYIVRSGETLNKIATRYGVETSEIVRDNNIQNANKIYPGQVLWIYGTAGDNKSDEHSPDLDETPEIDGENSCKDDEQVCKVPPYPSREQIENTKSTESDASNKNPQENSKRKSNKKKKNTPSRNKREKLETKGGKGKGAPVAIIPHSQDDAPWMEVAIKEGKDRWQWGKVKEANGGINYHDKIGWGKSYPTMTGDTRAWCASFINYCLQETGYSSTKHPGAKSFIKHSDFIKLTDDINKPIYGAIAVFSNSGHVALAYCITKDGEIGVLGGNQANSVTVNPAKKIYIEQLGRKFEGYYIPIQYKERGEAAFKKGGDMVAQFESIDEVREALGAEMVSKEDTKHR